MKLSPSFREPSVSERGSATRTSARSGIDKVSLTHPAFEAAAAQGSAVLRNGFPAPPRAVRTRGFTMVEVAISLAVIGFALVAIIGILPAGLNVQKENREETIINQEASLWMNAIRQGAEGMDYLVDYVDLIEVAVTEYAAAGRPAIVTNRYQFARGDITNGMMITGLLSTPKYLPSPASGFFSNHVVAYVRAVSGSATEKMPQDNQTVRESAFAYRLTAEVVPFYAHDDRWYDYSGFRAVVGDPTNRASVVYAQGLARNLHDVRLRFEWPLRPPIDQVLNLATNIGSGRQSFRTLAGGAIEPVTDPAVPPAFWRLQPGQFAKVEAMP
ncbi:MAG: type II secretion system GspH family protein [Verrucomicrobia bacterium]|jgi:prepilin-type N-terminal cleavage/methylation domain-containing protein|nr:type II secretion system GspH family protein [Verrucomicrobiota bacterium]